MRRFLLVLRNEFALFRTTIPAHAVAVLQPVVLYLLMTTILVHPTFDMAMARTEGAQAAALAASLERVGSPIGSPYVRLELVDWDGGAIDRQVIRVEDRGGTPTAVQHFGMIDSNLVKNFRNWLTAAALLLWNDALGPRAVTVTQHPSLPRDVSYDVYFGMALLTMSAFLAAAIIGAMLTAQEFEFRTVAEYRLAPASLGLILGGRLVRLALSGLLSAGAVWLAVGLVTGVWPRDPWLVALILLPVAVIAGCVGMTAALLLRRTIPAFLVGLVGAFAGVDRGRRVRPARQLRDKLRANQPADALLVRDRAAVSPLLRRRRRRSNDRRALRLGRRLAAHGRRDGGPHRGGLPAARAAAEVTMRRFLILLRTELLAWRHDPISALGGFVPTVFLLLALGLLFGGPLSFNIAVVNHDAGPYGAVLRQTCAEVLSPFGTPYYAVSALDEDGAWAAYRGHRLDGVWVIPEDFSARLAAGENPEIAMHFSNYNDDRAKNHRIYSAEILWRFYEEIGQPAAPLALAERYPLPAMLDWFPIMAVGVALLSFMLGSMTNMFMLTQKEQVARITLEFGLAPRPLLWVLLPKTLLSLVMGLLTGTVFLGILALWPGVWPGRYLPAAWVLAGLVILFWAPLALLVGLRARYFAGMIALILAGLTVFFVAGGLGLVRANWAAVPWFSKLVPNTYAIDPLRDLVLFHTWPADWGRVLLILAGFAAFGLMVGWGLAARQLRRAGN